jgi:hypothetical protein
MHSRHSQSGSVLIVVIVLLLLAGVLSVFALNSGVFEQRTSGNDLRAKLVDEIASAGLAQGMEYLHQHPAYLLDTSKWAACTKDNDSFPCGSVPEARRSTMWYWKNGGHDFDGDGSVSGWEARMLPIPAANLVTKTGNGLSTQYGVGAVICRVASKTADTDPTVCTDFEDESASATSIITFVSVAGIKGEGARTTATQSVGGYNLLGDLANAPPILASGSVDVTGGIQVVTNPNSGGAGVPVSVWSRKSLAKTGTPNTCYYNEFLHNSSGDANGTVYLDPASPNFPLCDDCNCAGADSLSFDNSGNKVDAGIDILQNSTVNSDYTQPLATGYANYDVKPEEFPCDLFAQVFRIKAWNDADDDDFCEEKQLADFKSPNTGITTKMGADEVYLFTNAKTIVNPTAAVTTLQLPTAAQLVLPAGKDAKGNATSAYPNSGFEGLVWCQSNCSIGANQQLGSAAHPVLLVIDSASEVSIQGKVFGLVFLRSLAGSKTLTPTTGYTMSSTEIGNGGGASLRMNAGAVIYGAVVIQGQMTKANGTSSVVYNSDVLSALMGEDSFTKFVGVPGSWTDRTSY